MRNTILSIIVEVLACNMTEIHEKKTTAEKSTMLREQLLGFLKTYMRDSNAVVRSRVSLFAHN
jgi:hypothetical protein